MKTYTLTLTHQQVDLILLALAERPLKDVLPTFQAIHAQCAEQQQVPAPPVDEPAKPVETVHSELEWPDNPLHQPEEGPDDPV